MVLQLAYIEEIEFLLYLTATILGVELVFYFFYRYNKIKDDRLPLNKILLSFGIFYFLLISGTFILTVKSLFISDSNLQEIIYKIGSLSILFSPISFAFFIKIKEFSEIINLKIAQYLLIFSLTLFIIAIFFPSTLIFTYIFFIGISLPILIFQIRLISTAKGNIKKRILEVFIGNIVSLVSLFFTLKIITDLYIIGLSLLILSFIITSMGVYRFPAFYEFRWKENLLKLLIINQKNNGCLYSHDFTQIKVDNNKDYEKMFSGGIVGIDSIISVVTNTQGFINEITHLNSLILLDFSSYHSTQLIFALVVKKDLKSNRYFLKSLKEQFESFYKDILKDIDNLKGNEEQLFGSFDIIIENIMHY